MFNHSGLRAVLWSSQLVMGRTIKSTRLSSRLPSNVKLEFSEAPPIVPPPPIACCGQGCIHCVWVQYIKNFKNYIKTKKAWHLSRLAWAQKQTQDRLSASEKNKLEKYIEEDTKWKDVDPEHPEYKEEALSTMDPLVREFWEMEQRAK